MDAVSVPDSRAAGGSGGRDTAPVIEPPGSTGDLFGFERAAPDWSSAETTVTLETGEVEAGAGALAFTLAGTKAFIRSRAFSTSEMGMAGPRWTLSVFVGQTQTDQNASIRLWFDCPSAGLNNQFVDYQRLPAVAGQWAPMVFQVPGVVTSALTTPREGCRLSLEHVGSGLFRYDDLRFAP